MKGWFSARANLKKKKQQRKNDERLGFPDILDSQAVLLRGIWWKYRKNDSRALRMDSFLELMNLSGISLMSVSLCPFWLKCCGTASVVLFCMALRCSPNLWCSARFVCPMYSAKAVGVFCISGIGLCRWDFRMHMWLLLDVMYLACVFECAWWQAVLNEGAGFTFFELHFLIVGGLVCVCTFFTFG